MRRCSVSTKRCDEPILAPFLTNLFALAAFKIRIIIIIINIIVESIIYSFRFVCLRISLGKTSTQPENPNHFFSMFFVVFQFHQGSGGNVQTMSEHHHVKDDEEMVNL